MEGETVGKKCIMKKLEQISGSLKFMTITTLHTRATQSLLGYDLQR